MPMQALIALSLASSNAGPAPIPEAWVIGHQDLTLICLACDPVANRQENSKANAISLFTRPPSAN